MPESPITQKISPDSMVMIRIGNADHAAMFFQNGFLGYAGRANVGKSSLRVLAKDFPDPGKFDGVAAICR